MKAEPRYEFPLCGPGRPQVVLIGNGPERSGGQLKWQELVEKLTVADCLDHPKSMENSVPFPLLYQLLATSRTTPWPMDAAVLERERAELGKGIKALKTFTTPTLELLPQLGADHILTTNYTYCLERAFFGARPDFLKEDSRKNHRFSNDYVLDKCGCLVKKRELNYRLHTGYWAPSRDKKQTVGLWHIHGECTVPGSIILGHDGYGRLLHHVISELESLPYGKGIKKERTRKLYSWPELFLFGDVYVVGLGLWTSEIDLWWLLRRKQRERWADGRVYFFDKDDGASQRERNLLLRAHGVLVNEGVDPDAAADYEDFYQNAFAWIQNRIAENRAAARA